MAWYGHLEFYPFTAPAYGLHMAFLVPGKHSVPELYPFQAMTLSLFYGGNRSRED